MIGPWEFLGCDHVLLLVYSVLMVRNGLNRGIPASATIAAGIALIARRTLVDTCGRLIGFVYLRSGKVCDRRRRGIILGRRYTYRQVLGERAILYQVATNQTILASR